jgi:hypothetical protein
LNAVFFDAQYICLYRSALDSAKSNVEKVPGLQGLESPEYEATVVSTAIDGWCRSTEQLLALEAVHKDRTLRVRYEDLVTDVDAQLDRVWTFLGVQSVTSVPRDVFRRHHDDGPGDFKITGAGEIRTDRIGAGFTVNVKGVSPMLRERVMGLLDRLGY